MPADPLVGQMSLTSITLTLTKPPRFLTTATQRVRFPTLAHTLAETVEYQFRVCLVKDRRDQSTSYVLRMQNIPSYVEHENSIP